MEDHNGGGWREKGDKEGEVLRGNLYRKSLADFLLHMGQQRETFLERERERERESERERERKRNLYIESKR